MCMESPRVPARGSGRNPGTFTRRLENGKEVVRAPRVDNQLGQIYCMNLNFQHHLAIEQGPEYLLGGLSTDIPDLHYALAEFYRPQLGDVLTAIWIDHRPRGPVRVSGC